MKSILQIVTIALILPSVVSAQQFQFSDGAKRPSQQGQGQQQGAKKNTFELVKPNENTPQGEQPRLGAPQQPLGAPQQPLGAPQQQPVQAPPRPDSDIPNPEEGPMETFVYVSELGTWKAAPLTADPGKARYRWPEDGSSHNDRMYYLGFGYVIENEGFGVRPGSRVATWVYESTDAGGNSIYFYFGVNPIRPNPRGPSAVESYPVYYSWDAPGSGAQPKRLLTESGTTRY